MLRITENDLLLFKYLFESGYIPRDFILDYIWNYLSYGGSNSRLSRLLKNGYLKSKADPFSATDGTIIFPTEKSLIAYDYLYLEKKEKLSYRANSKLNFYYPDDYSLVKDIDINSLRHDVMLQKCRFILEEMGVDYWESDRMIYRKYNKNPDGTFIIGKDKYAVEFERRLKEKSRYKKIFKRYAKEDSFAVIIYITDSDLVYNSLSKYIQPGFIANTNDWYKKYRLLRNDDLINENIIIKNEFTGVSNNLTTGLKKYLKFKEHSCNE